jgi:uncharacterized membrane protein YkoI
MRAAETAGVLAARALRSGRHEADGVMRANRTRRLLLMCAICVALSAHAREISVQEAVAQAQHETDGKVLSVQTLNVGKRKVYRIKILTRDGQVRIVQVQAEQ